MAIPYLTESTVGTTSVSGDNNTLMIALAKGRLTEETLEFLEKAKIPLPSGDWGRKLILESSDGALRYVLAKPADVPTYVEYGAADLGICGLDVLRESGRNVYEPLVLPFGYCRLSLAGKAGHPDTPLRYETHPRVATSFPRLTAEFFQARGVNAEIIPLKGSVELGPLVGLTDLIVDLVSTGSTLKANGLVEIRTILNSQAILIANRAAYRLKHTAIHRVIDALRSTLDQ
jgi:ATP phosphoribosyltransferase